jgi:hypothetical protein
MVLLEKVNGTNLRLMDKGSDVLINTSDSFNYHAAILIV